MGVNWRGATQHTQDTGRNPIALHSLRQGGDGSELAVALGLRVQVVGKAAVPPEGAGRVDVQEARPPSFRCAFTHT